MAKKEKVEIMTDDPANKLKALQAAIDVLVGDEARGFGVSFGVPRFDFRAIIAVTGDVTCRSAAV